MQRFTDYEAIASQYDCRYKFRSYSGIEQTLVQFVGNNNSSNLLEVGSGTGHWLQFLANHVVHVTGIDLSMNMLLRARELLDHWPLVKGRAEELPFPKGHFDRIFCINAFHHFTDKPAFLSEARRVLRSPGGLLMIGLDPHTKLDKWWVYDYFPETIDLDNKRYLPASDILTAMKRCGFTRCEITEVEHIQSRRPAKFAAEQGFIDRGYTSQLAILSDEEYTAGLHRLNKSIEEANAAGEDLLLIADLRLYAVLGWTE